MRAEGVEFVVNAHVGDRHSGAAICVSDFDAILLAGGAEQPRDLNVPGRELKGHSLRDGFSAAGESGFVKGDEVPDQILATGKRVVIIGGGDTGADCLGTSHRHRASHITQFELLPKPPETRAPHTPWPLWPMQLRVESSHEEGGIRDWSVNYGPVHRAMSRAT